MRYNISKRMSKQLSILKIISIIMVVFIHANVAVHLNANVYWEESIGLDIFKYLISENISRVAVPMFFSFQVFYYTRTNFHILIT